jgi:hypothetical protein
MPIVEFDPKQGIGKGFGDGPFHFNMLFFRHAVP